MTSSRFTPSIVLIGRQNVQVLHFGAADRVTDFFAIEQHVVESVHAFGFLHAETAGGVTLRIAVNDENLHVVGSQGCGKINGGGSLSYPTF